MSRTYNSYQYFEDKPLYKLKHHIIFKHLNNIFDTINIQYSV